MKNFVILILCIGMMPLFLGGYCGYFLILLFPVIFFKGLKLSNNAILVLSFSFIYTLTKIINGFIYTPSSFIFDFIFPLIVYQAGCYLAIKITSNSSLISILTLLAIFLALPAILYNITDTLSSGQLINVQRIISDDSGDITRSATGYGSMVSIMAGSISVIFLHPYTRIDKRLKNFLIPISIGALFATIHLLNRSGLIIAAICIVLVFFLPPVSKKKIKWLIIVVVVISVAVTFIIKDNPVILQAIELYQARNDTESQMYDYEMGGRFPRWVAGLELMVSQPLGSVSGLIISGAHTYAHNLWIDAGIQGGIFSCLLLLIITFKGLLYLKRIYVNSTLTYFEKNYLVIFTTAMFLQAFVEPIIEGVPQFFWLFIFWFSVTSTINRVTGLNNFKICIDEKRFVSRKILSN